MDMVEISLETGRYYVTNLKSSHPFLFILFHFTSFCEIKFKIKQQKFTI